MANPRYAPQQERTSPGDRKLSQIAGLVGLSNSIQAPALEQRAAAEREHQNRVMAALQLLGLNQQSQQEQATQQYRGQELQQRGDIASADRTARADENNNTLGVALATHFGGLPGVTPKKALQIGGTHDAALGKQATTMDAQDREAQRATFTPTMKAVGNVPALEAFRPHLDPQYPGLFDEIKSQLWPDGGAPGGPAPTTGGLTYTGPSMKDVGALGMFKDIVTPQPTPAPTVPLSDQPDNPFTFLFGKDNFINNYLRSRGR